MAKGMFDDSKINLTCGDWQEASENGPLD